MCVNPFYILCLLVSSGFLKELSDRDDFDDKKHHETKSQHAND